LDHWAGFKKKYPGYAAPQYDEAVQKMLGCGRKESGYATYRCMHCGEQKVVCFSCKSGFCLSCAKAYVDRWVDYISSRLFAGITYRHVVLTMPKELRIYFYRDKQLLGKLMATGHKMMENALSHCFKEEVEVGSIVVAQTAGRSGEWNPHLHIIMTSGGLTKGEVRRWRELKYIPFEVLHRKWQYYLFGLIKERVGTEEARRHIDKLWEQYPNGLVAYLEKGEVPEGGKGLARYLAKYVVSPPIALGRITEYSGEEVAYWWRDHKSHKREYTRIGVMRFIGRMVQHILPKGFQRIRYYGLHGTCKAEKVRESLGRVLMVATQAIDGTYKVIAEKSYRGRIEEAFGVDPFLCKQCGTELELEQIYHPKYGVIYDGRKELMRDEIRTGPGPGRGYAVRRAVEDVSLQMQFVWT
jgi:hypothetical protein